MITYVDAKGTSSLCLICGEKLSPNGYRQMKCSECELWRIPDGCRSFRSPRKPSH